jgi:hypothetical protein
MLVRRRLAVAWRVFADVATSAVPAMTAVHEDMQQRAGEE